MSPPAISIIMPAKNAAAHIEEALASILAQTFTDWELLVVLGASRDSTQEILASYPDKRIRVVREIEHGHTGIAAALNLGILNARGKCIARMDADDIALPTRLEYQYFFLTQCSQISMCFHGARKFGLADNLVPAPTTFAMMQAAMFFKNPVFHSTVMWKRKDFLAQNLFYNERLEGNEDIDLWIRASRQIGIAPMRENLLLYREHDAQTHRHAGNLESLARVISSNYKFYGLTLDNSEARLAAGQYALSGMKNDTIANYLKINFQLLKRLPTEVKPYFIRELFIKVYKMRKAGIDVNFKDFLKVVSIFIMFGKKNLRDFTHFFWKMGACR